MVQSRKEPTLSSDIHTALDDEPQRKAKPKQRTAAPNPGAAKAGEKPSRPSAQAAPAAAPVVVQKSGGGALAGFALFVGVMGLGLAAFAFWQLNETRTALSDAETRIVGLEQRLELSDDESTQSVTALQANLKKTSAELRFAESEIRKLWDTRNVNRKAISDNKSALGAVSSKIDKGDQQALAQIKSLESSQKASLTDIESSLSSLADEQKVLSELVSDNGDIESLERQIASLKSQLAKIDDLTSRITNNEEAIDAIDAYRLNINRQLVDLQKKVSVQ
ncbi:hypothetical protein [Sessilibacter corallicola]|uniref:Uncharacterized protein n=1 Tax=Sessilibacter corallicola TaxID=2904075 RepID=A0ABQ0A6A2_9GAMM|nr:hypothetical protein [Sessilibacter corallicola]MCE2028725.1 hypothetical protein [Sessilibacter corallicola]